MWHRGYPFIFLFDLHIFVYILSSEPVHTDNTRSSLKPAFFCPTLQFSRRLFVKEKNPYRTFTTRVPHVWLWGEFTEPHVWCDILDLNRGTLDWLCQSRNTLLLNRWWNIGDPGKQTWKSLLGQQWPRVCLTIRNVRTRTRWTSISYPALEPSGISQYMNRRTNDDRFPLSLWDLYFFSTLG